MPFCLMIEMGICSVDGFHSDVVGPVCRHQLFVQMVREQKQKSPCEGSMQRDSELTESGRLVSRSKPAELPCYDEDSSASNIDSDWKH